jgi:hypothetical protein
MTEMSTQKKRSQKRSQRRSPTGVRQTVKAKAMMSIHLKAMMSPITDEEYQREMKYMPPLSKYMPPLSSTAIN